MGVMDSYVGALDHESCGPPLMSHNYHLCVCVCVCVCVHMSEFKSHSNTVSNLMKRV